MQGTRSDNLYYRRIAKYVSRYGPIPLDVMHQYLQKAFGMQNISCRCRLINRLETLNLIKRIGGKRTRETCFVAVE